MTPFRAKRNSKAPERFSSDETKVDAPSNHANQRQGDKSESTKKSNVLPAREPLKVKLPKLKRPQTIPPPHIKVKISRVNGTNKSNLGAVSPAKTAKIKLSLDRPKNNNNNTVNKTNSPKDVCDDIKKSESNRQATHRTGDLKISLPVKEMSNRNFGFVSNAETKSDDMDESSVSSDRDASHGDDLDSSFSSRNSDGSAMQIIVERRKEPNNSGIRCPCGVEDDLGVMVECERCSTWQHGHCINVCSEEDAYEGYICGYCLFPAGKHTESLHQLTVGDRFQSKFDNLELLMRKKADQTNSQQETVKNRVEFSLEELELAVQDLKRVFHSLKVKWKLLNNDDYSSELKVWQNPIWSEDPAENLKQRQRQTVSFVGDIYKSNLRLHLSSLLSNMQKRCQLIRYQIMETHETDSRLDNLLMLLDDISKVVEGYSEEIRQN